MPPRKPRADAPVALLDMDGTLCDFDGAWKRDIAAVTGGERVSEAMRLRIGELVKARPGWWAALKPIPLGFRIARACEAAGFRLVVLTRGPSRSTAAWSEKVEWCARHLPQADVTVTHDKSLVYGKVLVDDWPEYIEGWVRWRPRGLVLMPAQPWNRKFRHSNVRRIASAADLKRARPELLALAKS